MALALPLLANAQSVWDRSTPSIKLYNEFAHEDWERMYRPDTSSIEVSTRLDSRFNVVRPTVAVQWGGTGAGAQEIELTRFYMGKNRYGDNPYNFSGGRVHVEEVDIAVRYEYTVSAVQSPNQRWQFSAFFGGQPYWRWEYHRLESNERRATYETKIGLRGYSGARVNYALSDRWLLGFDIPLTIFDASYYKYKDTDRDVPVSERVKETTTVEVFPTYVVARLGLVYRF